MANKTIRTYVGDGVTTIYSIDFTLGFTNRDYVYIYLDSEEYTTELTYTWLSDSQIELTTAVADTVKFHVRRVVPRGTLVNDYENGAILREEDLDNSFKQTLMTLEEVEDGFVSLQQFQSQVNLNMLGNRIINLGEPTSEFEAVNKGYVDRELQGTIDYVDQEVATRVRRTGDAMTGTLGGIDATAGSHFMPQMQVVETIDARVASSPGFDPNNYQDYGLITATVTDTNDYGGL